MLFIEEDPSSVISQTRDDVHEFKVADSILLLEFVRKAYWRLAHSLPIDLPRGWGDNVFDKTDLFFCDDFGWKQISINDDLIGARTFAVELSTTDLCLLP